MSDDANLVERIVREVLARFEGAEAGGSQTQPQPPRADATLRLEARVVTASELEGRLAGVKVVALRPRAIVTPAARDLLRERAVTIATEGPADTAGRGARSLAVGVADTSFDPAALLSLLQQDGAAVEQLARTGLVTVIDELADQVVRGGRLGLLLTDAGAAAVCLANRRAGVRAALGADGPGVARAVRGVAANFLVVEPGGKGLFALRQSVREFCRGGPRDCPAEYRNRLA